MNPIHVNPYDLSILSSFGIVSKEQTWTINKETNENDKSSVQAAIRAYLLPEIEGWEKRRPGYIRQLKHSLQFYLNVPDRFPIEKVYESGEPVFELPIDPLDYYRWAWELLFGNEDYHLGSLDGFIEVDQNSL